MEPLRRAFLIWAYLFTLAKFGSVRVEAIPDCGNDSKLLPEIRAAMELCKPYKPVPLCQSACIHRELGITEKSERAKPIVKSFFNNMNEDIQDQLYEEWTDTIELLSPFETAHNFILQPSCHTWMSEYLEYVQISVKDLCRTEYSPVFVKDIYDRTETIQWTPQMECDGTQFSFIALARARIACTYAEEKPYCLAACMRRYLFELDSKNWYTNTDSRMMWLDEEKYVYRTPIDEATAQKNEKCGLTYMEKFKDVVSKGEKIEFDSECSQFKEFALCTSNNFQKQCKILDPGYYISDEKSLRRPHIRINGEDVPSSTALSKAQRMCHGRGKDHIGCLYGCIYKKTGIMTDQADFIELDKDPRWKILRENADESLLKKTKHYMGHCLKEYKARIMAYQKEKDQCIEFYDYVRCISDPILNENWEILQPGYFATHARCDKYMEGVCEFKSNLQDYIPPY